MDVLYYAPTVHATAAVRSTSSKGVESWDYYKLDDEIVSCSVSRRLNQESSFTLNILNRGGKYTDFFHDQDRITISCSKPDSNGNPKTYRLLTGYISAADTFKLYGNDLTLTGADSIHQLALHYWDPQSTEAYALLNQYEAASKSSANNMSYVDAALVTMLTEVAGWDSSRVSISDVPTAIVTKALNLYTANKDIILGEDSIEEAGDSSTGTSSTSANGGGGGFGSEGGGFAR